MGVHCSKVNAVLTCLTSVCTVYSGTAQPNAASVPGELPAEPGLAEAVRTAGEDQGCRAGSCRHHPPQGGHPSYESQVCTVMHHARLWMMVCHASSQVGPAGSGGVSGGRWDHELSAVRVEAQSQP